MTDNTPESDINSADETSLKRILLCEEIKEKRRAASLWGKIKDIASVAASGGALVAALVALYLAQTQSTKQLVEVYETKAEYYRQKEEITRLEQLVATHNKSAHDAEVRVDTLQSQENTLRQRIAAMENAAATSSQKPLIGVNIELPKRGREYYVDIASHPAGASASIFAEPRGAFVFPDSFPGIDKCIVLSKAHLNQKTPCRMGPFLEGMGGLRNDLWVVVDFGTHREVRLVCLQGD